VEFVKCYSQEKVQYKTFFSPLLALHFVPDKSDNREGNDKSIVENPRPKAKDLRRFQPMSGSPRKESPDRSCGEPRTMVERLEKSPKLVPDQEDTDGSPEREDGSKRKRVVLFS
jgi:hypothetical protein